MAPSVIVAVPPNVVLRLTTPFTVYWLVAVWHALGVAVVVNLHTSGGETYTPLVPDVMIKSVALVYQPPTNLPSLRDDCLPNVWPGLAMVGVPVVNQ